MVQDRRGISPLGACVGPAVGSGWAAPAVGAAGQPRVWLGRPRLPHVNEVEMLGLQKPPVCLAGPVSRATEMGGTRSLSSGGLHTRGDPDMDTDSYGPGVLGETGVRGGFPLPPPFPSAYLAVPPLTHTHLPVVVYAYYSQHAPAQVPLPAKRWGGPSLDKASSETPVQTPCWVRVPRARPPGGRGGCGGNSPLRCRVLSRSPGSCSYPRTSLTNGGTDTLQSHLPKASQ